MKSLTTVLLALCMAITVAAQVRLPRVPLPRDLPLPGLDRLLRGESPVSTTIKDARIEVPWLDRLSVRFDDLATLRNQRGSFTLKPGHWAMDLQSFCFRAGTRAPHPTDGQGFLSGTIAGPHAEVFSAMLTKYGTLRDVDQHDMQTLVWAILSRTKIRNMSLSMQALAARVLTPAQILALDSGALDVVPMNLRRRTFGALPAEVRRVVEAENRLREMLYRANHTYAELEAVAVLAGPRPADAREVPPQRWSLHPRGFLVRYHPSGYARTTVELAVPGRYQIRRDAKGRIVAVDFGDGRRTETEYDDAVPPFEPAGNPLAIGYAFKSIKLIRPGADGRPEEMVLRDGGWTFVTRSSTQLAGLPQFGFRLASAAQPTPIERFQRWKERYDHWNEEYRERAEWYRDRYGRLTSPPPGVEQTIRDLEDLDHYRDGIEAALTGDPGDRLEWLIDHQERMNAALERATLELASLPDGSDDGEYVPSMDVALPASPGMQRLGLSSRRF